MKDVDNDEPGTRPWTPEREEAFADALNTVPVSRELEMADLYRFELEDVVDLHAAFKAAEARVTELEAEVLAVAQALGVVREADGHAPEPGPATDMVAEVRRLHARVTRLHALLAEPSDEEEADRLGQIAAGAYFHHYQWQSVARALLAHMRAQAGGGE